MNCCQMSIISIVICINIKLGAGTVLFGFIQVCEKDALQTADHLRDAWRLALQSLQWHDSNVHIGSKCLESGFYLIVCLIALLLKMLGMHGIWLLFLLAHVIFYNCWKLQ